jgi:hypothetical protein
MKPKPAQTKDYNAGSGYSSSGKVIQNMNGYLVDV